MPKATSRVDADQRRTGLTVAAGLLLLVFGIAAALACPAFHLERNNPFWVIGMLVIFAAALSLITIVFSWLGLGAPSEAFGLPPGSIRTLLAVGVMVLFAVFGLAAVSLSKDGLVHRTGDSLGEAVTTPQALASEEQRYKEQGIVAAPVSVDGGTVKLHLYRDELVKPADTADMQKQLLTALVTLLTSVISFYFGSRSAAEAQGPDSSGGDVGGAASLEASLKAIDDTIADADKRLAAVRSEAAPAGGEAALAASLDRLAAASAAVKTARAALAASPKDASSGDAPDPSLAAALAALRTQVQDYTNQLREAEGLVAKG